MAPQTRRGIPLLRLAIVLGLTWVGPVHAQKAPDEVVVQGRREEGLDRLLKTMAPTRMGRQVARWDRKICTRIYGLAAAHAAFVRQRVSDIADQLGIGSVRSENCQADIVIIFALDADAVTADLIKRYPYLVGEVDLGAVNHSTKAPYLRPHPVRWLGQDWLKEDTLATVSRIHSGYTQAISANVAIVDLTKLAGISWGQLADFLAFVTLSRPTFDRAYDDPGTILSLFSARDAGKPLPAGMTALDMSFLTHLYRSDARQLADHQQQDIRRHVKADLAKAAN